MAPLCHAEFAKGVQAAVPHAVFKSVTCASTDSCVAVGSFPDAGGNQEAFAENFTDGI